MNGENKNMKEIKEHDVVIINNNKVGTIIHIYPDGLSYEIEYVKEEESFFETVNIDNITMILNDMK